MLNFTKIIMALLIVFAGCISNKTSQKQTDNVHLNYNIIFGTSGGFTGINQGFSIDSAGVVKSFKGFVFETAPKEYEGKLNADQINELNSMMNDIIGVKYAEQGNMTSYIRLIGSDENSTISWSGTTPDENVPVTVKNFYEKLSSIVKSLK